MSSYGSAYYKQFRQTSRRTAAVVVPLIQELLQPRSAVDVGCGTGEWLAAMRQAGVADIFGVDGPWVPLDQLEIPVDKFQAFDLRQPLRLPRAYDLAMSLEVAEHLPAEAALPFVESLVKLAPAVLFSAAIPYQGGTRHLNEQWPDYWRAHFEAQGFVWIDCFRWRLWDDETIHPFIAQNLMLYVSPALLASNERLREERLRAPHFPMRAVHPGIYQIPTLQRLIRLLRPQFGRVVWRRITGH